MEKAELEGSKWIRKVSNSSLYHVASEASFKIFPLQKDFHFVGSVTVLFYAMKVEYSS